MNNFLPERIKYLREENGLSQRELSEKLAVSKASISWYESGSRIPSVEKLIQLAQIFQVSIDFLLGYEYQNDGQRKNDEMIIRSIKRSTYLYHYISENPRSAIENLEKYAKKPR